MLDGREIVYHIYSAATVKDTDDVYLTGFENDEAYQSYLDMTKRIAIYDTGVKVTTADSVVTLSTCTSASDIRTVLPIRADDNRVGLSDKCAARDDPGSRRLFSNRADIHRNRRVDLESI